MYRDVLLRRWRNALGRTMRDFPGGRDGGNRYLVLGLSTGQAADLTVPPGRDELIAYGPLLCDECYLAGDGGASPGTRPRHRTRHLDPGPVRRHRGPQLAIRRAAIMIRGHRLPALTSR